MLELFNVLNFYVLGKLSIILSWFLPDQADLRFFDSYSFYPYYSGSLMNMRNKAMEQKGVGGLVVTSLFPI